jgi:DNA-binding IclR family transcriptional regulator
VIVEVGSVMPMLDSATGRAFLSFLPPERTRALVAAELAEKGRDAAAAETETAALVRETRAAGLGRTLGEFQEGISALAAPIVDPLGRMVGAVTALGRAGEFDAGYDGAVGRALKAYCAGLAD